MALVTGSIHNVMPYASIFLILLLLLSITSCRIAIPDLNPICNEYVIELFHFIARKFVHSVARQ